MDAFINKLQLIYLQLTFILNFLLTDGGILFVASHSKYSY